MAKAKKEELERWWLVVCDDGYLLDWFRDYNLAKYSLKYYGVCDGGRLVRGVCSADSSWACGKTWREAELNYKNNVFDNYQNY